MFSKRDWISAVREWPTATIVGAVFGTLCALIAKMIGIPTLDQLEWPMLTGLGYILIFFVSGFLSVLLLAAARIATGGLKVPQMPDWMSSWFKKTSPPPAAQGGSLPLLVTLSSSHFTSNPGLCPKGAVVVSATLPGGQSTASSDESSIDNPVFVYSASITNLSDQRMILQMRLLVTNKEGHEAALAAGNLGSWRLRMGEHDAASVFYRKKGMPVPVFLDFPLTIEGRSNVLGKIAFIVTFPRDLWLPKLVFNMRQVVEITDMLSGKSITLPKSGTYRSAPI